MLIRFCFIFTVINLILINVTNGMFILKLPIEKLEGIKDKELAPLEEVDGKKVRRIVKGDISLFTIPSWWGKTNRPKEGEIFILEIDFRDDVSYPVIVLSFGNCANSFNGLSELHRIGGCGDKKWKVGYVPVSWDYLYAGDGNPGGFGNQVFGIQVNKEDKSDLLISEIRIRNATLEDEKIYNSETREWIKKVQSRHSKENIIEKESKEIDLSNEWKSKECIPFVRNYLEPILPSDVPEKNEVGVPLKIRMALNEIECGQFGIYANGTDLEKVTIVDISPLLNEKKELFSGTINLFTIEYSLIQAGGGYFKIDAQRIWPMYKVDITKGKSHGFWIKCETNEKLTKPGKYIGEISIETSNIKGRVKIPIEIEVMPIKLLSMNELGLTMGGCVTGFVPFHNIDYAVKNNINAVNLWFSSVRPGMSKVNGKLRLDFTLIDEWMREAKKRGWKKIVYFLGGDPYGFPKTMTLERELFVVMQDEGDRKSKVDKFIKLAAEENNRNGVIKEIRELYCQWVKEVTEHAKENDWPELILTPFDEPAKYTQGPYRKEGHEKDEYVIGAGPWIKPHFEDACELIKKYSVKGTKIYGSIHHAYGIIFLPKINIFCTNAIHEDSKLGEKVIKAGNDKEFWQYTGVGAGSEPAKMRYSFGFFFGAFNSTGSLLWAYNWGSRFDTTEGYNWLICWDTPFSTIPTLSFEGLREAWDDRRYIETLRKLGRDKGKENEIEIFLKTIFDQVVQSRTSGGRDTIYDFWSETKDPKKLDEWRYMIADKIIKLSGEGDSK